MTMPREFINNIVISGMIIINSLLTYFRVSIIFVGSCYGSKKWLKTKFKLKLSEILDTHDISDQMFKNVFKINSGLQHL